jgi:hypothetical protein
MNKGFLFVEFLIVFILAYMLISVFSNKNETKDNPLPLPATVLQPSRTYQIVHIGNCEYIESKNPTYAFTVYTLCHKGDCTNHPCK